MIAHQRAVRLPSSCPALQQPIRCPIAARPPSAWHPSQRTRSRAIPPLIEDAISVLLLPSPGLASGTMFNTVVFVAGIQVLLRGLTWAGVLNSWLLGTLVFSAFGWGGYVLVCLYFLFGTAVTKVKLAEKQAAGIAEARSGRRGPSSVWGSGLAGAVCAAAALLTGDPSLWRLGFVASFVSKLSDTVSSEIGKAYGRTTYLVTTLQLVPRGTEGAVSLEGSAAGLGAAAAYAGMAWALGQVHGWEVAVVAGAAMVANLMESYIGAAVQGRVGWLTNDVVNVIQICTAAGLAMGVQSVL